MADNATERPLKRQGLFLCEREIAYRLSQSEKRWRGIVRQLERDGLPRIDPVMGGRYWPAVLAYFNARYGIPVGAGDMTYPSPPDGPEHWDAC